MTRAFQGYDEEKDVWEQFNWDLKEDPTPEDTGYKFVEEIIK